MVFLIGTKISVTCIERLGIKLGYMEKLVEELMGRSGGLCLFWSDAMIVDLLSYLQYHIDVKITSHCSKEWCLTGFYGNPEPEQSCHIWNLLCRLRGMSRFPWFCMEIAMKFSI